MFWKCYPYRGQAVLFPRRFVDRLELWYSIYTFPLISMCGMLVEEEFRNFLFESHRSSLWLERNDGIKHNITQYACKTFRWRKAKNFITNSFYPLTVSPRKLFVSSDSKIFFAYFSPLRYNETLIPSIILVKYIKITKQELKS